MACHAGSFSARYNDGIELCLATIPMNLFAELPLHLAERCRWINSSRVNTECSVVVYWMRNAARIDENPALDVARLLSRALARPLLIYHAVSDRYLYASDRHHAFILEGARDVSQACRDAGLAYAFHLEGQGCSQDVLRKIRQQAAIVVTEDMPTDPTRAFTKALARGEGCGILAVDTACIVPMQTLGRSYTRAFEYRQSTKKEYDRRINRDWPVVDASPCPYSLKNLPFEPIELDKANLKELIGRCDIDHTIPPVADTIGGSTAGYQRWFQFCYGGGLREYAKVRNQAEFHSTSRMSAYLHYGMVSPFRMAREAFDVGGEGAEKYLDELLIWRELAYAFCFYREDHHRISAIPDWAIKTLKQHECDPREKLYTWEELTRGQTDDPIWNASQKSLLLHGELHNNLRMTWGKMFLRWTRNARSALRLMLDLNNRYALDGRDPSSYGGILWCLGQFDRPFAPETKIFGTVRSRTTLEHAKRLDLGRYEKLIQRERVRRLPKVAIIGAGISGAIAARTLKEFGLNVTVFEKSPRVGGRMATRVNDEHEFDHGAQYFTARDARMKCFAESWKEAGIIHEWHPRLAIFDGAQRRPCVASSIKRFVPVPTMRAVSEHLLSQVTIRTGVKVETIQRCSGKYDLVLESGEIAEGFDWVISSVPAPQAAALFAFDEGLSTSLAKVQMLPCWAMLVEFATAVEVDFDAAFVNQSVIRWLAFNNSKQGRSARTALVVHADFDWSQQHLEANENLVQTILTDELSQYIDRRWFQGSRMMLHRWRYAISHHQEPGRILANDQLIACGDWAGGARVEGAFLSGCAAAGKVLRDLTARR